MEGQPPPRPQTRAAVAVSIGGMFMLLYLVFFQRTTTAPVVWAAAWLLWLAPVLVIVVAERKR